MANQTSTSKSLPSTWSGRSNDVRLPLKYSPSCAVVACNTASSNDSGMFSDDNPRSLNEWVGNRMWVSPDSSAISPSEPTGESMVHRRGETR